MKKALEIFCMAILTALSMPLGPIVFTAVFIAVVVISYFIVYRGDTIHNEDILVSQAMTWDFTRTMDPVSDAIEEELLKLEEEYEKNKKAKK